MTKFKEMRIRKKMTQVEVAKKKGVSQVAISSMDKNGVRSIKAAKEYSAIFNCQPFLLLEV